MVLVHVLRATVDLPVPQALLSDPSATFQACSCRGEVVSTREPSGEN